MADIIQLRRDTAANWTAVDPVLAEGEFAIETDTYKWKIGNGVDLWSALPYGNPAISLALDDLTDVDVPAPATGQHLYWDGEAGFWKAKFSLAAVNIQDFNYRWAAAPNATPASGQASTNNANPTLVTIVYIHQESRTGNDLSFIWDLLTPGDWVNISAPDDTDTANAYDVTGTVTKVGEVYHVPVTLFSSTPYTPTNNANVTILARFGQDVNGLPPGGTDGQMLYKVGTTDYDAGWYDAPTSLPPGGEAGQVLTKQSNTDGDAAWENVDLEAKASLYIQTCKEQTYALSYDMPFSGAIYALRVKTQSGTCSVTGKINGVPLGTGAAVDADASVNEVGYSTNNVFNIGDTLEVTISNNAAAKDLEITFSDTVVDDGGDFSPIDLSPAAWYDPSDLSTMFQNVEGSQPVTTTGQPVGLMLDKSEELVLGPEIAVNGSFDSQSNWTLSPNVSISGGQLVWSGAVANSNAQQVIPATSGAFCEVTIDVASVTQGAVGFQFDASSGADIQITTPGVHTFRRFQRSIYSTFYVICYGTTTAVVNSVSVKAVLGNHISQETAAKRPQYQSDGTLHWLLNDGVDDYLMGTPITEQAPPNEYWLAAAHVTGEGIVDGLFRRAPSADSVGSSSNVSGIFQRSDVVERLYVGVRVGAGAGNSAEINSAYVIGGPAYVARAQAAVSPDEVSIDSGGAPVTTAATYGVPDGYGANILYSSGVTAQVKVFGGVIFNKELTTGNADELRAWLRDKAGI